MKKSDREIMEILEAFDARSAHSAGLLAGVDAKTVRRYVTARDARRAFLKSGELAGVFGVAHGGAGGGGDVGDAVEPVDADGEVAEGGHDAGCVAGADL